MVIIYLFMSYVVVGGWSLYLILSGCCFRHGLPLRSGVAHHGFMSFGGEMYGVCDMQGWNGPTSQTDCSPAVWSHHTAC